MMNFENLGLFILMRNKHTFLCHSHILHFILNINSNYLLYAVQWFI